MQLDSSTKDLQIALARYCRGLEEEAPREGTSMQHTGLYKSLIEKVYFSTLKNAFPIAHSALSPDQWQALVNSFIRNHPIEDPRLWKMPLGLVEHADAFEIAKKMSLPYLDDLLHFEWLEIQLYMQPELPNSSTLTTAPDLKSVAILNPDSALHDYSYPVFAFHPDKPSFQPGNFSVFGFRHRETDKVHFIELSVFTRAFIKRLHAHKGTVKEVITLTCKDLEIEECEEIRAVGIDFVYHLYNKGAILGCLTRNIHETRLQCV